MLRVYFFSACTGEVNHADAQAQLGKSRRKEYKAYDYRNIKNL